MTTPKLILLATGTLLIILFSWFVSLREKRYHGIPRFFVFEGLLILGLLQAPFWFRDPFAIRQIVSWLLFIVSISYALFGISIYFKVTQPGRNFENTSRLVTTGLYKYIRHPMYASLLLLGWGMMLKDIRLTSAILATAVTLAVYLTCKVEEKEMIAKFGDEYKLYMKRTKMWIPWVA